MARRHDASLAYGTGALTAAANYNLPEKLQNRRHARARASAEERLAGAKAAPAGPEKKTGIKAAFGELQGTNLRIKHARRPLAPAHKQALLIGALTTGPAALWYGGRNRVRKDYRRRDFDRDAAGAVAGAGSVQAAAVGTKHLDRHLERKVSANPEWRKAADQSKKAHGDPKVYGDPAWPKVYQHYPKGLPGWRYRRVAAHTLAGRGIIPTSAAMAGVGVLGARHLRRDRVGKSAGVRSGAAAVLRHSKHGALYTGAAGSAAYGIDRHRNNHRAAAGFLVGAAAGQGAYQGAGKYVAHRTDHNARSERKLLAAQGFSGTKQDRMADEHFARYGLNRRSHTHDAGAQYREMFRHYPLELPGAKAKRMLAHTHAGRSGDLIGGAVTLAGAGTGAVALHRRGQVHKATEFNPQSPYERYAAERTRRRTAASGAAWAGGAAAAGTGAAMATNAKLLGTKVGHLGLAAAEHHPAGAAFPKELARAKRIGTHAAAHKGRYTAASLGLSGAATGMAAMHRFRSNEEAGISQGIGRIKAGDQYGRTRRSVSKGLVRQAVFASDVDWSHPHVQRAAGLLREHPGKVAAGATGVGMVGGSVAMGVSGRRRRGERARLRAQLGRTGQVAKGARYGVQEEYRQPAKMPRLLAGTALMSWGLPRTRMAGRALGVGRKLTPQVRAAQRAGLIARETRAPEAASIGGAALFASGWPRHHDRFTPVVGAPVTYT